MTYTEWNEEFKRLNEEIIECTINIKCSGEKLAALKAFLKENGIENSLGDSCCESGSCCAEEGTSAPAQNEDAARIGDKVTFYNMNTGTTATGKILPEVEVTEIIGEGHEEDAAVFTEDNMYIKAESPIGQALLGAVADDIVAFDTPQGEIKLWLLDISR